MIFGQPPYSPYDLKFVLARIPVRVHPLFWLVAMLLGASGNSIDDILIWVLALFVSILVHELGHALAAKAYGWRPEITLYGMGGLTSFQAYYTGPWSQILVTVAGPGAGFLFGGLVALMVAASGHHTYFGPLTIGVGDLIPIRNLRMLVDYLLFINFWWGTINLFPVYPLDGGQIARDLWLKSDPGGGVRKSLWLSVVAASALALWAISIGFFFMTLFFAAMAYGSYKELKPYGGSGLGGSRQW